MKSTIGAIAVAVAIVGTYVIAVHPRTDDGSRGRSMAASLVITPDSVDFGDLIEGQVRSAQVRIENRSEKPCNVAAVYSSCGCSRAKASATLIPPAGAITVEVGLDSRGRDGEQRQQVKVLLRAEGSAEAPQELTIPIRANVHNYFRTSVQELLFAPVRVGAESEQAFDIHYESECGPHGSPSLVDAPDEFRLVVEGTPTADQTRVKIVFTPRERAGIRNCQLRIDPGIAGSPPRLMSVHATAESSFHIEPRELQLRLASPDDATEHHIAIRPDGPAAPKLLKIDRLPPFLSGQLTPSSDGYVLSLKPVTGQFGPRQVLRGDIILLADSVTERYVEIPVIGLIADSTAAKSAAKEAP